jgi:hypothetical protein
LPREVQEDLPRGCCGQGRRGQVSARVTAKALKVAPLDPWREPSRQPCRSHAETAGLSCRAHAWSGDSPPGSCRAKMPAGPRPWLMQLPPTACVPDR